MLVALEREVTVRQEEECGAEFTVLKSSLVLRWIFLSNRTSCLSDVDVLNQGTRDLHLPLQPAGGALPHAVLGGRRLRLCK